MSYFVRNAPDAGFRDFNRQKVAANGIEIARWISGGGTALLPLHGYPQTHFMWHKIADRLSDTFTVIAPDLRGYGDSDKPDSGPDQGHATYSKRVMAQDQVEVMAYFRLRCIRCLRPRPWRSCRAPYGDRPSGSCPAACRSVYRADLQDLYGDGPGDRRRLLSLFFHPAGRLSRTDDRQ